MKITVPLIMANLLAGALLAFSFVLPRHHHGGSQPHPGQKAGSDLPRLRPFAVPDIVFKINSDFEDFPAAADAATQFLEGNNASEGVIFAANLAIEEIVTNTIKYGYDDARKLSCVLATPPP